MHFTMVISLQVNSNAYNCADCWGCICEKCFQMFYFVNSCLLAGQFTIFKTLFLISSLCEWSNVHGQSKWSIVWSPLLQGHLLVSLSSSDGSSPWFCCVLPPLLRVCSYVYFHFKPVPYIWKELLRCICLGTFIPLFLPLCLFPLLFHFQCPFRDLVVGDRSIPVLCCCFR